MRGFLFAGLTLLGAATVAVLLLLVGDRSTPGLPAAEIVVTRCMPDCSRKDARSDLYVVRPDGSRVHFLASDAHSAAASPDGQSIAFVRSGEIWVMRRDGSGQRRVTLGGSVAIEGAAGYIAESPAWSPDGLTIVFGRSRDGDPRAGVRGTTEIVALRSDGSRLEVLAESEQEACFSDDAHECNQVEAGWERIFDPAPSPDGVTVAFTHGDYWGSPADEIWARPGDLQRFLFPRNASEPAWSPDGSAIAYYADDYTVDGDEGIYVSRDDGSEPILISATALRGGGRDSPAWSPDGRWIAFSDSGISLVHLDGTGLTTVVPFGYDASWLPAERATPAATG